MGGRAAIAVHRRAAIAAPRRATIIVHRRKTTGRRRTGAAGWLLDAGFNQFTRPKKSLDDRVKELDRTLEAGTGRATIYPLRSGQSYPWRVPRGVHDGFLWGPVNTRLWVPLRVPVTDLWW